MLLGCLSQVLITLSWLICFILLVTKCSFGLYFMNCFWQAKFFLNSPPFSFVCSLPIHLFFLIFFRPFSFTYSFVLNWCEFWVNAVVSACLALPCGNWPRHPCMKQPPPQERPEEQPKEQFQQQQSNNWSDNSSNKKSNGNSSNTNINGRTLTYRWKK